MTRWTEFDEPAFLERLRTGDQAAYRALIRRFHQPLTSMAHSIIGSMAQAEEVAQDTWLAFFSSIGRFEGRSSVVSWLFSILMNRARTRASQEKRLVALPPGIDGASSQERAVPLTGTGSRRRGCGPISAPNVSSAASSSGIMSWRWWKAFPGDRKPF